MLDYIRVSRNYKKPSVSKDTSGPFAVCLLFGFQGSSFPDRRTARAAVYPAASSSIYSVGKALSTTNFTSQRLRSSLYLPGMPRPTSVSAASLRDRGKLLDLLARVKMVFYGHAEKQFLEHTSSRTRGVDLLIGRVRRRLLSAAGGDSFSRYRSMSVERSHCGFELTVFNGELRDSFFQLTNF